MSHMQLAFLATVVSPKVASAAAQRALECLASKDISTADLEDYLPAEEPSNGKAEAAVAAASQPAAEEVAGAEPPAASEPASQAGPAQAEGKAEDAKHEAPVKDEPVDQEGHAAGAAAAPVSNGEPAYASPPRADSLPCRPCNHSDGSGSHYSLALRCV